MAPSAATSRASANFLIGWLEPLFSLCGDVAILRPQRSPRGPSPRNLSAGSAGSPAKHLRQEVAAMTVGAPTRRKFGKIIVRTFLEYGGA